ncbi:hypothetical protein ACOME3_005282 [Neoechinorhynchus agilis]
MKLSLIRQLKLLPSISRLNRFAAHKAKSTSSPSSFEEDEKLQVQRQRLKEKIDKRQWIRLSDIPIQDRQKYQQTMLMLRLVEVTSSLAQIGLGTAIVYFLYKKATGNKDKKKTVTAFDVFTTKSGCVLPKVNQSEADESDISIDRLKSNDVVITGMPRSGMSLVREIAWLLRNHCDLEKAKNILSDIRTPCLHRTLAGDPKGFLIEYTEDETNSGIYTSLIPLIAGFPFIFLNEISEIPARNASNQKLPTNIKIICCVRNPYDAAISGYNALKKTKNDIVPLGDFLKKSVLNGESLYGPWWRALEAALEIKCLVISFEDLIEDTEGKIRQIADYLELDVSDDKVSRIKEWISKSNFWNQPCTNLSWLSLTSLLKKGETIMGPTATMENFNGQYGYAYDTDKFGKLVADKLGSWNAKTSTVNIHALRKSGILL